MVLRISDGCRPIRAYRGFDGTAARALFHGIVQAPDEKERDTQRDRADKHRDKHRRNDCELHRRGALLVETQQFQLTAHDQPNLIIAVLVIGVAKVPVTVMPGNNGA